MREQPENSQNPRPTTNRDSQGTSVVMDPKTTKVDKDGEEGNDSLQQDASEAKPRSMPWPEIPTTRSSTRNKKAPLSTKPNLDDEWLSAFQEPEETFLSNETGPGPVNTPLRRTTKAQAQRKNPAPTSPSPNFGNEWVATSRQPQQISPEENIQSSLHPSASQSSEIPAEGAALVPEPVVPPSPISVNPASHDQAIDTPSAATTKRTGAEWQNHNQDIVPEFSSYAPVSVPQPTEPSASCQPPNLLAPPPPVSPVPPPATAYGAPSNPQTAPDPVPATTQFPTELIPAPHVVTPPVAEAPNPNQAEPIAGQELYKALAPQPHSYAPVSVPKQPEPPVSSMPLSPTTSAPEAPEMTPSEACPPLELTDPFPSPPASIASPFAAPTSVPASPRLDQTVGTLGEQIKAGPPNTTEPSPQAAKPMDFQPPFSTVPGQLSRTPPSAPAHNVASPSFDEEWVASQNEAQEELPPTIVSSYSNSTPQAGTALEDPHQPHKFALPNDWLPTDPTQSSPANGNISLPHTDSDAPERESPSPEGSGQQENISPQPETPEDFVSSGNTSVGHVVQAWPSTQSGNVSRKSQSATSTRGEKGADTLQAEDDVTSGLDSEGLEHAQSGEEEYAPLRLRHPSFTGTGNTLFGIFTTNTVWTLLTLGIYSFWGRINIRRYLCSQTKFAGARFAFHGTGGELLLGWVKALVAFGIPYSGLNYISNQHTEAIWQWSLNGLTGLLIACFIPMAIVGSHRYRMSRTSWRGIRFSFRRSIPAFTVLYLKGVLLSLVTLGIYYPVFEHARRAFLTSGTYFGNQAFGFDGNPKTLGQMYFKAFRRSVLTLVTAEVFLLMTSFLATQFRPKQVVDLVFLSSIGTGIIVIPILLGLWFWFQAAKQRYMWNHTTFGPSRFRATMKGRHLFELKCTNLILLVSSLGLAWPWVQKRNVQFQYYHVGFRGPLQLHHIMQQANSGSPIGEELAGFFDAGFEM